ncbi:MAG: NAD(+)/NADH kinase [Eubacteriales bacterium]|nr:NAD(+)/NADH kinase [Eubacteriales bacterium]MDD4328111.1 NAD(+)/NADH kinase [Eubacteriales bacterium]
MRIGIIPNPVKDLNFSKTCEIAEEIRLLGGVPVISGKYHTVNEICNEKIEFSDYSDCEIIMCLGGDGTFLTAIQDTYKFHKPLIGVNLGSLGFLAEINADNIKGSLQKIFNGEYTTEKRMMIETTCTDINGSNKGRSVSLNDIVISRGGISRILDLDFYIDDHFIERIPGDGMIVSTPTGSTAYSLSAGGPIIQPDLELLLINPLNPHTLHNRCYVAGKDSTVKITVRDYPYNPLLTSDGTHVCNLVEGDNITIRKSKFHMHLIRLQEGDFYRSISSKIFMRGR